MKAISLKPSGTAINFRRLAAIPQFLSAHALGLAVISTIVTVISAPMDAWAVAAPASFIALGAVYHADKKGGEA